MNDHVQLDDVKVELEALNNCTDEINRLEVQLDEANAQYRSALSETSNRLVLLQKRLGSCVERSRPYYEARDHAKKARIECQAAAVQFQRAATVHSAARETIALAEEKFLHGGDKLEMNFDSAWQEKLNHATIKVMEAEMQLSKSQREHQERAHVFQKAEETLQGLEIKLKSEISKSRLYFEQSELFNKELQLHKERVDNLQRAIADVKERYSQALNRLEMISEKIHETRKLQLLHPREPGVGAEKSENDIVESGHNQA